MAKGRTKLQRWLAVLAAISALFCVSGESARALNSGESYTIERYFVEDDAISSTTSTSYSNKATLTITPPTTKYYLVMATGFVTSTTTSNYIGVILEIDGTNYADQQFTPRIAGSYVTLAAHKVIQLSSGSSHTVRVRYKSEANGTSVSIKDTHLCALEVSNYHTAELDEAASTTSSSFQDAVTLTFTAEAADYLIIATGDISNSSTSTSTEAQVTQDGAATSLMRQELQVANEYETYGMIRKVTLTAASHTFKIQYRTTDDTGYIDDARITAVKTSDFSDVQYGETEAESNTTSTTYQDKNTLTFTPGAQGHYLVVSSALIKNSTGARYVYGNYVLDGSTLAEQSYYTKDGTDYVPMFHLERDELTKASHTLKIQYKIGTTGTAYIKNARSVAIRFDSMESYTTSGHTAVSNSYSGSGARAYIWVNGISPSSANYVVSYYDGNGNKVATDSSQTTNSMGQLVSEYLFSTNISAAPGTWHAAVFEGASTPSAWVDVLSASGYVTSDTFEVSASSIPELPGMFSLALAVAMCLATYFSLKKKCHFGGVH